MDLSADDLATAKKQFNAKAKAEGTEALSKAAFKALVKVLMQGEKDKPSDKDLDAAFVLADEDKGGTVDLSEFVNLYKLIKRGEVVGLGKRSLFGSSSGKRANSFKSSLKASSADVAEYNTATEGDDGDEQGAGGGEGGGEDGGSSGGLPAGQKQQQQQKRRLLRECYDVSSSSEVLGKGAYATVLKGMPTGAATDGSDERSSSVVAVKSLPKASLQSHEKEAFLANEVAALEKCKGKHPGVLQLIDFFDGQGLLTVCPCLYLAQCMHFFCSLAHLSLFSFEESLCLFFLALLYM